MECREVRQLGEAFVSEQLLVETTHAVIAHLDRCPACRAEIEGLRRLRATMRSAIDGSPELSVRPEFAAALRLRLRAEAGQESGTGITRRRWLAIAASSVLVAGAGWGWREWAGSRVSALVAAAVGDHRFCAITFMLPERPIPLDEAARRYGKVYARFDDVEPSAPALSGGPLQIVERHSCVFEGQRFAHIVLLYKNEKVSLLVTDDMRAGVGTGDDTPTTMPVEEGFHVASFRKARHAVFVVSSLTGRRCF